MRSRWRLGSRLLLATLAALVSMLSTAHAEAAPPAQAVAAHYTRPVLIDNFTANSIGKNWFAFNRDGGRQLTTGLVGASQAYVANGMLTIETDTSGYGTGLQSINSAQAPTSTPEAPILSGSRLFRYGYFEARMKYNPNGYRGSERGWPAFWAGSLARSYPHIEIDFLEAQPSGASAGSPSRLSATIHEWTSGSDNHTNGLTEITPPEDFDPASFNTYGCLWTPSSINFYVNNHVATMPKATNPTRVGPDTPFPSAATDGVVLILRSEERGFLDDMPAVLGERAMAALCKIQAAVGLEYAGVDFALAGDGSLLLFEANATMAIIPPDGDPIWDYRRRTALPT